MHISFKKIDQKLNILFEDQSIALNFVFLPCERLDKEQIIYFKGLLHTPPIKEHTYSLIFDQAGLISLNYNSGKFNLRISQAETEVILPIGMETYETLDQLLNHLV